VHHSTGSGSAGRGAGGRIYPWVPSPWLPPAGVVDASQGMQCAGRYVVPGDSQDSVFNACGPPSATRQVVYALRDSERVVDVWTYEGANTVTRTLRFENGMLTSIGTVGPLRR
jgi:hypothetical protein